MPSSTSFTFCVAADPESCSITKQIIEETFGAGVHKIVLEPTQQQLESLKTETAIVLVIFGPVGVPCIQTLCDDYSSSAPRRVKLIYSLSAGVDTYRIKDFRKELTGIPFCNAQGCFSNMLAEHVLFSVLHFNRFPWRLQEAKQKKRWEKFSMLRAEGQKMAIFGYGNIGEQCGRLAVKMGMNVTGIRRNCPPATQITDQYGVTLRGNDAVDEVLREADVVVGVLPATPETDGFFNKAIFSKMKKSALFINIGRGSTQNEVDIFDALQKDCLRGAALDVFRVEPLPVSSPLWTLPDSKVLLSPHCADITDDLIHISAIRLANIVKELINTKKVTAYTVDLEKGY